MAPFNSYSSDNIGDILAAEAKAAVLQDLSTYHSILPRDHHMNTEEEIKKPYPPGSTRHNIFATRNTDPYKGVGTAAQSIPGNREIPVWTTETRRDIEPPHIFPSEKENKYPPVVFEYNEDQFLDMAKLYIASTYTQHYVGNRDASQEKPIQVIDLLVSTGHAESFFLANAIKYLARYGKKDGKSKKDLLKTIHYVCLLLNLNHKEDPKNEAST